jgi:hypothetical protein
MIRVQSVTFPSICVLEYLAHGVMNDYICTEI